MVIIYRGYGIYAVLRVYVFYNAVAKRIAKRNGRPTAFGIHSADSDMVHAAMLSELFCKKASLPQKYCSVRQNIFIVEIRFYNIFYIHIINMMSVICAERNYSLMHRGAYYIVNGYIVYICFFAFHNMSEADRGKRYKIIPGISAYARNLYIVTARAQINSVLVWKKLSGFYAYIRNFTVWAEKKVQSPPTRILYRNPRDRKIINIMKQQKIVTVHRRISVLLRRPFENIVVPFSVKHRVAYAAYENIFLFWVFWKIPFLIHIFISENVASCVGRKL